VRRLCRQELITRQRFNSSLDESAVADDSTNHVALILLT
jgi:hypothetical protein